MKGKRQNRRKMEAFLLLASGDLRATTIFGVTHLLAKGGKPTFFMRADGGASYGWKCYCGLRAYNNKPEIPPALPGKWMCSACLRILPVMEKFHDDLLGNI